MRRSRTLCLKVAPVLLLAAVWLSSARAKADITLFDQNGWTFYTNGLVASHYQLVLGDADPLGGGKTLVGGRIGDTDGSADQRNNTETMSDIRSGFIGTQVGFGMNRQISPTVHVDSFLAINMNGINNNRGQDGAKGVDYREGWAAIVGPYGTLKFGRMFGLFASSSAQVVMMAYQFGVGHPCAVNASTISCGSVGAGPLYASFDAAFRYTSPRIAGFQIQVAMVDPSVGAIAKMSPYPRVDGEVNYDQTFGPARLRLIGQGMFDRIENSSPDPAPNGTLKALSIWGLMGTGLLDVGGLSIGGGAWTGAGVGEHIPLEAADAANPITWDNNQTLRHELGVYGNVRYNFQGTALTVGGGELLVKLTDLDKSLMTAVLPLKDQYEYHVTLNHRFDALVVNVEYMRWHTDWEEDPALPAGSPNPNKQSLNFMGAGVNYLW